MLSQDLGRRVYEYSGRGFEMFYYTQGNFYCCIAFSLGTVTGGFLIPLCTMITKVSKGEELEKIYARLFQFFHFLILIFLFLCVIYWFSSVIFCFYRYFWIYFVRDLFKYLTPPKVLQLWYFVWQRSFNFGTVRWNLIQKRFLSRRPISLNLYETGP